MDVEATPAYRSQEVDSTKTMINRVEQRVQLKPHRLVGDTAYGTGPLLSWMVKKAIEPYVPVWDKSQRKDDTFSSNDFHWNEAADEYLCPQGHALLSDRRQFKTPRSRITKENTVIYRASPADCSKCVLKSRCCPNTPTRRIKRSIYEDARNVARALAPTWNYRRSRRERKKIEMLFAHLKTHPEAGPVATPGTVRRARRVPVGSNGTKSTANGEVADAGCRKSSSARGLK